MTEPDPIPVSAPTIEHAPAAPARRGVGGTLFTLFLFVLLAGGLYYVWTNPMGQTDPEAITNLQRQIQAQSQAAGQQAALSASLTQQLQALADRVDKLEKAAGAAQANAAASVPQAPSQMPDLGDLPQRVDALSAKVAALASQAAPAPLSASAPPPDTGAAQQALAALSQRVEQIEAGDRSALGELQAQQKQALDQSQGAVLAQQKIAISALDNRLSKLEQGAGTIEDAASRASRLGRVQAAIVALEAGQKLGTIPGAPPELARFANEPAPTEANLRETFPALAAHAREVSQPQTAHRTFLQRALARLQQSVTVRQGDDVLVGDPAAGVLSDAEVHVQNGDLAGAVQRLGALSGPAAMAMAGWVDQARALVAARVALANMAARG
jgi:hypothetical protein